MTRMLSALLVGLLTPLPVAAAPAKPSYTLAGSMITVQGHRLSLYCEGRGAPTVVLESGLEEWAPEWSLVQGPVSKITRTCAYDRAGYGFSDPGPMPRTNDRLVGELHDLLKNAEEVGPFILVGHSFGGVIVRSFASRYPSEVAGIVLDDSENEEFNFSLAPPHDVDAYITSEQNDLQRCASGLSSRARCLGLMFRGLPEKRFSSKLNAAIAAQVLRPRVYETAASELSNFTEAGLQHTLAQRRSFGCTPLTVLTADHHPGLPPMLERRWVLFAKDFLALSCDSRQIIVQRSGHDIELDRPQAVVDAIKAEIAAVKRGSRGRAGAYIGGFHGVR